MKDMIQHTGKEVSLAREKTKSPEVFIDRFLSSDLFNKGLHSEVNKSSDLRGYNDFVKELKSRNVTATENEIRRTYLGMSEVKLLLIHFAKYELMFEYDKDAFSKDDNRVSREFGRYKALVQKLNSDRHKLELDSFPPDTRRTKIVEYDAERQFRHIQTLNALYEGGYVPSKMVGRAMARIMLISEGLDTFERVKYDEEQRFRRLAEATLSRI